MPALRVSNTLKNVIGTRMNPSVLSCCRGPCFYSYTRITMMAFPVGSNVTFLPSCAVGLVHRTRCFLTFFSWTPVNGREKWRFSLFFVWCACLFVGVWKWCNFSAKAWMCTQIRITSNWILWKSMEVVSIVRWEHCACSVTKFFFIDVIIHK